MGLDGLERDRKPRSVHTHQEARATVCDQTDANGTSTQFHCTAPDHTIVSNCTTSLHLNTTPHNTSKSLVFMIKYNNVGRICLI